MYLDSSCWPESDLVDLLKNIWRESSKTSLKTYLLSFASAFENKEKWLSKWRIRRADIVQGKNRILSITKILRTVRIFISE